MSIVVRPAVLDDAHAIASTHTRSIRAAYAEILHPEDLALFTVERTKGIVRERIEREEVLLVGLVDGVVAGHARWGEEMVDDWPHQNLLHALFIDPDYQGRGVGKALISACARSAQDHRHCGMMIGSLTDNPRAWKLYESLGARFVEDHPIDIGSHTYANIFLAWDDLSVLLDL